MAENALISVIIPAFNRKEWICDAIESVLNQTYPYHEIIVIDDGSSDDTGNYLRERYGNSIRYIYQENKGPSAARNRGLDEASGSYIQFLDSDDLITPEKFQEQLKAIEDDELALSISDYCTCDINDIKKERADRYLSPVIISVDPIIDLISRWEIELSIPVHCFLFKASFFKSYGIRFDESLPNHEDWDCWMKIFRIKPVIRYINQKYAIYRINNKSICYDSKKMKYGYLKAIQKQIHLLRHETDLIDRLSQKRAKLEYVYKRVELEDDPYAAESEFSDEQDRLIAKWDQLLAARDRNLLAQRQQIFALSTQLTEHEQKLSEKEQQLATSRAHVSELLNSYSWKIMLPLRWLFSFLLRIRQK